MTAEGGFLYTDRGGDNLPPGLHHLAANKQQRVAKAANLTNRRFPRFGIETTLRPAWAVKYWMRTEYLLMRPLSSNQPPG